MVVMKIWTQTNIHTPHPKFIYPVGFRLGSKEIRMYYNLDLMISFRVRKSMTCSYYGNIEYKFMANRKFLGL